MPAVSRLRAACMLRLCSSWELPTQVAPAADGMSRATAGRVPGNSTSFRLRMKAKSCVITMMSRPMRMTTSSHMTSGDRPALRLPYT